MNPIDKTASRWWRDVCKCCGDGQPRNWFDKHIKWKLGTGYKIRFWEDVWVGDQPLNHHFPRLYNISYSNDKIVNDMGKRREGTWYWIPWRRDTFVWKGYILHKLMQLLVGKTPKTDSLQKRERTRQVDKNFSIRTIYYELESILEGKNSSAFKVF